MKKLTPILTSISAIGALGLGLGGFISGNIQAIVIAAVLLSIVFIFLGITYHKGWFYE